LRIPLSERRGYLLLHNRINSLVLTSSDLVQTRVAAIKAKDSRSVIALQPLKSGRSSRAPPSLAAMPVSPAFSDLWGRVAHAERWNAVQKTQKRKGIQTELGGAISQMLDK